MTDNHEPGLDAFRAFVASQGWTYAKTVPESPHEYLMRQHCNDPEAYEAMVALIRREGDLRPWTIPGTDQVLRYRYLTVDNYDYWATTRPGLWSLNRRRARRG